jgi:flagellar hook-associated protein 3
MKMQGQMSTGRRINKASDDPIGTHKDLRYRSILSNISQYKTNISSGLHLLSSYDNIFGNMKDMLQAANEIAISMNNEPNNDPSTNLVAAEEINSIITQLYDMVNTRLGGRYILSGFKTRTEAFTAGVRGYQYQGDKGVTEIEVESASKMGVNVIGSDVLMQPLSVIGKESDLSTGIVPTTLLSDLHLGNGVDLTNGINPGTFKITNSNLDPAINTVTIDISTAINLNDAVSQINNQLAIGGFTDIRVDYSPDGINLQWVISDGGLIDDSTLLANLNMGDGVDLENGQLRFHNADDSIDVTIDISGAETIGDVRTIINGDATLQANGIMAIINLTSTGLDILDIDSPATELIIDNIGEGSTASNLGIEGNIGAELNGRDLNPKAEFVVSESETGQTTITDLGLEGIYNYTSSGEDLNPRLQVSTELDSLKSGRGIDLGRIRISQGLRSVVVNLSEQNYKTIGDILNAINGLGLDILATINPDQTGIQIAPTIDTETLLIEEVDGGQAAHEWGIFGSPDIMGNLMLLEDALLKDDRDTIGKVIGDIYAGIDHVLNRRASVGAKVIRLEAANSHLADQEYNFTNLLSEVEDADLTKLISELAMQENSYQAALVAASKIIQPSLTDFLK